jgi:hypothetical protein
VSEILEYGEINMNTQHTLTVRAGGSETDTAAIARVRRLLASAPDLLAALRELYTITNQMKGSARLLAAVEAARTALAKASGSGIS